MILNNLTRSMAGTGGKTRCQRRLRSLCRSHRGSLRGRFGRLFARSPARGFRRQFGAGLGGRCAELTPLQCAGWFGSQPGSWFGRQSGARLAESPAPLSRPQPAGLPAGLSTELPAGQFAGQFAGLRPDVYSRLCAGFYGFRPYGGSAWPRACNGRAPPSVLTCPRWEEAEGRRRGGSIAYAGVSDTTGFNGRCGLD